MKLELELNTDICEIINVGMYDSVISGDNLEMTDFDEIGLEIETEKDFGFNEYKQYVCEKAIVVLKQFFSDIKNNIDIKIVGNSKIVSPSYYNYSTDVLYFDIEIEKTEIEKIINAVLNNKEFFDFCKKFKSHSGFVSFTPDEENEFMKAINGNDIERSVSLYLMFLNYEINDRDENENKYQTEFENDILENVYYEDFLV